jgi:hypothetical protein
MFVEAMAGAVQSSCSQIAQMRETAWNRWEFREFGVASSPLP